LLIWLLRPKIIQILHQMWGLEIVHLTINVALCRTWAFVKHRVAVIRIKKE